MTSRGLIGAGKRLALGRYGDGWNGLKAIDAAMVLDIGSCGGELAERELLDAFPNAQIHCFEPHPVNFARLGATAARHPRIHAHQLALGEIEAEVDMQFNTGSPSSSSLLQQTSDSVDMFPFLAETMQTTVHQKRLDDVMPVIDAEGRGPLVIKMDVQGFEDRVIAGAPKTLARASAVVLEVCLAPLYEGQATFDALYEAMKSHGFRFAGTRDQFFGKDGSVIYLDACFIR
ncbi:FkbM family methyltransferase [Parerythrobacter jejuensis]|uniref:FkbM family methyltransferase n=1 Tax=Parerythrobacter jejuensis TaxID=795812 RepID=A0A845API1_9SPHN|nr:FkbM family methyltransferase [Parerythrobacter jejuensis]MXP32752.1 FkbM family methyltransferase [Parerythrobacter jejuensis]